MSVCPSVRHTPVSYLNGYTVCLKKTGLLQLISHNFTNSQRSLIIFWHWDILFNSPLTSVKKFLNWLRTSCVVSITTAATLHIWTADFWDDFEQRIIIDRALNERQKELSYRKQIARQLRTQYVEGIYDNPVTLQFRLTVTQGHWKQNQWVDHTRLTIRRVIKRWILSWPWNVGQRSLKVIDISAIRKL